MQLGAYFAGVAIENSMLGATHACANPLSARYGTTHGHAIAVLLPQVVRWNSSVAGPRYAELIRLTGDSHAPGDPSLLLATRLEDLARAGGLPRCLSAVAVQRADLNQLAE